MSFIPFLQEAAAGAAGGLGGMGLGQTFLPLIAIILIFYLFLIRPQNKKQKETEKMLAALKKGDKVITIGGIHGVVASVKENTVIIKVDSDAKIEFNRSAISTVELTEAEKAKLAAAKAEKKGGLFKKNKKAEPAPAKEETAKEEKAEAKAEDSLADEKAKEDKAEKTEE